MVGRKLWAVLLPLQSPMFRLQITGASSCASPCETAMLFLAFRMKDQIRVALCGNVLLSWSSRVLPGLSWAAPKLSGDLLGSHTGTRGSRSVAALLQLNSRCEEVEGAGAMMCPSAG